MFGYILIGIAFAIVWIVVTKLLTMFKIKKDVSFIKALILPIISPDYVITKKQKSNLEKENEIAEEKPITRATYIKKANKTNLLSTFLGIATFYILFFTLRINWLNNILLSCVAYRLCSRTIEINISFMKDIIEEKKDSDLSKWDRIKLAFTSLLEEAILFAGIYLFNFNNVADSILGGLHSFILSPVNFCNSNYGYRFIAIYQVICTIILITLSFATYISQTDKGQNENT